MTPQQNNLTQRWSKYDKFVSFNFKFYETEKSYLQARKIIMNVSSNIRAAKKKNSDAWPPNILASDTRMTMMFPNATVRSHNAWRTDFMLVGAWL